MSRQKNDIKGSYDYLTGGPKEWKGFQERNKGLKLLGAASRAKTSQAGNKDGVISKVVDVYSDGTRMQATLWIPEDAIGTKNSHPAILMCHGWGGIRDHLDARFGKVFAKAGFVVLTFDYRGWNDSDGIIVSFSNPEINKRQQDAARESDFTHGTGATVENVNCHIVRQVIDMDWQIQDIEAALAFLQSEPVVDPTRIGIWGISQGGGHVVTIGARHRDKIKAIVSQVPSMGDVGAGAVKTRQEQVKKQATTFSRGLTPMSVPQGVRLGHLEGMDGVPNLAKLHRYRPLETAHLIQCPIFVMDAEGEEIFDRTENGEKAFKIVSKQNPQSQYAVLPGRHYDAYDGPKGQFKEGTAKAIEFFRKHLGQRTTTSSKL